MNLSFVFPTVLLWAVSFSRAEKVLPKEASPDTPWEDLKAVLTSADILTPGNVVEWQEQCIQIFEDVGTIPGIDGSFAAVTQNSVEDCERLAGERAAK